LPATRTAPYRKFTSTSAFCKQFDSNQKKVICVHPEHFNGRATDWGPAHNTRAFHSKMLDPGVVPRVKQPDELTRSRIDSGNVRSLEAVAVSASQSEIGLDSLTPVLFGNNVIDLKRQRKAN
jgi:hypothetical protein